MKHVRIRTLEGCDLEPVLGIWNRALTRDPISAERFVQVVLADADYWQGPDSGFFIAELDDRPAGFLRAIIRRQPNDRLGLEPEDAWIPYFAVDPAFQRRGVGRALVDAALDWLRRQGRQRIWVCGTPTSAPGSIVPGVDVDAYPAALTLLRRYGFEEEQPAFSMAREIVDFDVDRYRQWAGEGATEPRIGSPEPGQLPALLDFLAEALPGAWNIAARQKIRSGALHELLIAETNGRVVGYCQWSGEHFGPFGVAPEARRQHVGARLFTEAVQRIRAAGGRRVWFNWANDAARRFYERFGLHVTRRFTILCRRYTHGPPADLNQVSRTGT